jgi:hypothetical protein
MRLCALVGLLLVGVANDACVLQQGTVAGRVMDCRTRQPVAGATLVAHESDWGWSSGGVVWDKAYNYSVVSDAQGRFTLQTIRKPGFRFTLLDTRSNNHLEIGMLSGPETAWSRNCRPSEECLKTWMDKGVQISTDICAQ